MSKIIEKKNYSNYFDKKLEELIEKLEKNKVKEIYQFASHFLIIEKDESENKKRVEKFYIEGRSLKTLQPPIAPIPKISL